MAVTNRVFVAPKYIENVQTTQYTAPGLGRAVIDKFTVTNIGAVNASVAVNILPSVGSPGSNNLIVKDRVIAPNETYTFPMVVGHTLETQARISAIASVASALVLYVSGREIT